MHKQHTKRQISWRHMLVLLASILPFTIVVGCGDACKDLAQKICQCEASRGARIACLQKINSRAAQLPHRSPFLNQTRLEQCADLFDGCNCDVLAAGNFKACGLSLE